MVENIDVVKRGVVESIDVVKRGVVEDIDVVKRGWLRASTFPFSDVETTMGGTQSKTTSEVLTKVTNEVIQEHIAECVTYASQSQQLAFKRIGGSVNIGSLTMRQSLAIDIECALSSETKNAINNDLVNKFKQEADAQGIGLISALGNTQAETETRMRQIINTSVSQKSTQSVKNNIEQSQVATFTDIGGGVTISDATFEQTLEATAKAIINAGGYSQAITKVSNAIDQTAKAKEENPLSPLFDMISSAMQSGMMLIIGVIMVVALVAIFFMKYLFTSEAGAALLSEGTSIAKSKLT